MKISRFLCLASLVSFTFSFGQNNCPEALYANTGFYVTGITSADFDQNTTLDIATCSYQQATISVVLNQSGSGFGLPVFQNVGNGYSAIQNADMNGDGFPDLVAINALTQQVSLLLNQGNGTFLNPMNFAIPEPPKDFQLSDMDLDGDFDLVVSSISFLLVYLNPGNGIFGLPVPYVVNPSFEIDQFALADLNGDSLPDAVAGSQNSTLNLALLLNTGNGVLGSPAYIPVSGNPTEIILADMNGDTYPDILACINGIHLLLNAGNTSFTTGNVYPFTPNLTPSGIRAEDLDQDGDLDIATSAGSIYLNAGNAGFSQPNFHILGKTVSAFTCGDFTGDTLVDLAVSNGDQTVAVLTGNGDGTFMYPVGDSTTYQAHNIVSGDFNGDGYVDAAIANHSIAGSLSVHLNNGNGKLIATSSFPAGIAGGTNDLKTADFDTDGDLDIALATVTTLYILYNNSAADFSTSVTYAIAGNGGMQVTDLDSDGDLDILTEGSKLTNNGSGNFTVSSGYQSGECAQVADYDGDGHPDLLMAGSPLSEVYLFLNDGNGNYPNYSVLSTLPVTASGTADFDADGDMDIALAGYGNQGLQIHKNNGNGTFVLIQTDTQNIAIASRIHCGDWNQDGNIDLAVIYPYRPYVKIYINNGAGIFPSSYEFYVNGNPAALTSGDYNGDGSSEIACLTDVQITQLDCLNRMFTDVTPEPVSQVSLFYPNPFNLQATLVVPAAWIDQSPRFEMYNVQGQKVSDFLIVSEYSEIKKGNLSTGMYFYRILQGNTSVHSGKVLLE